MTTREISALIGQAIRITDARTGETYSTLIWDARSSYGKLRIQTTCGNNPWFEPTAAELASAVGDCWAIAETDHD